MKIREEKKRVDTAKVQEDIEKARRYIYEQGYSVESEKVKGLLDGRSQTPNRVSNRLIPEYLTDVFTECLLQLSKRSFW